MKRLLQSIIERLEDQAGIGLVESLVAIALLGITMTSFVTNLSAGTIAVRVHNENTIAQGLAQTQIEVIKAAPYDKTGKSYQTVERPEGYDIKIAVNPAVDEKGNAKKTIQKVSVMVFHNEEAVFNLEDYKVNR